MGQVKEIPLLFTKENRAAVRSGVKTETRRKLRLRSDRGASPEELQDYARWAMADLEQLNGLLKDSPYGCPQLAPVRYWMREPVRVEDLSIKHNLACVCYLDENCPPQSIRLDDNDVSRLMNRKDWTRPTNAIHMLKSFTRTWLRGIRVYPERLGDITAAGAIAEGIEIDPDVGVYGLHNARPADVRKAHSDKCVWRDYLNGGHGLNPVQSYVSLWRSIHGTDSWDPNEVVWVIQFTLEP